MSQIIAILVISLIVIYADYRMTIHNCNVAGNGKGSIALVNKGEASLPAQRRVLVPWLCRFIDYYYLRWIAITGSLFGAWAYYRLIMPDPVTGVMLLALFFVWAALFDYTDGYIEVALFGSAFALVNANIYSGPTQVALIGIVGVIAGLNRETAVFLPLMLFLDGHLMYAVASGIAAMIGIGIPYELYPKAKRYCAFNQVAMNWQRMTRSFKAGKYPLHNPWLFPIVLAIVLVATYLTGELSFLQIGAALMFVVLLIPTVWAEIRVFKTVMLFVVPVIAKLLN